MLKNPIHRDFKNLKTPFYPLKTPFYILPLKRVIILSKPIIEW